MPQNCKKKCKFTTRNNQAKKLLKKLIWKGLGLHLGGVWEGGLVFFLSLLGTFGLFFFWRKPNFNKALVQNELQKAFRSIWGQFWEGFGRVGEDLGNSWEDLGSQN